MRGREGGKNKRNEMFGGNIYPKLLPRPCRPYKDLMLTNSSHCWLRVVASVKASISHYVYSRQAEPINPDLPCQ